MNSTLWSSPPAHFRYVRLERLDPERNIMRTYVVLWQPTLFGGGMVVRQFGRYKGRPRQISAAFPDLGTAWPTIRRVIRTRLRHGYKVVAPTAYVAKGGVQDG